MKKLIGMLALVLVGCATTQSNVVCDGNSKNMTCHACTVEQPSPVQYHKSNSHGGEY